MLTFMSGRQVYPPIAAVPYDGQDALIFLGLFPVSSRRGESKFREYDHDLSELVRDGHLSVEQPLASRLALQGPWAYINPASPV